MNLNKDGGRAFPVLETAEHFATYEGMTVRQYYKAAALKGLLANPQIVSCGQLKSESHAVNIIAVAAKMSDLSLAEDEEHANE